jgi:hypothetical protein
MIFGAWILGVWTGLWIAEIWPRAVAAAQLERRLAAMPPPCDPPKTAT